MPLLEHLLFAGWSKTTPGKWMIVKTVENTFQVFSIFQKSFISFNVGKLTIHEIHVYGFEKDCIVLKSFSFFVSFEKQCPFKVGKKRKRDCIVKNFFSDLDFEVKINFLRLSLFMN